MPSNKEVTMIDEYLPLRDAVLKALRNEILTGKLMPGERLLEIELSERLGVSRTPVREALHNLELEGLVTTQPRRGARVTNINVKALRDVLEVRLAMETLAICLACDRITEEQKQSLKAALEKVEMGVKDRDTDAITEADVEFHNVIFAAAHNERLTSIVNNLQEQMFRYRFEYIKDPSNYEDISREHRIMYDAIMSKDKDMAVDAIREHISSQEAAIMDRIMKEAGTK